MRIPCGLLLAWICCANAMDGPGLGAVGPAGRAAAAHVAAHEKAIVSELRDLVALPNVADNHDDIRRNAAALVPMLEKRGIAARILETPGAPVAVFGDLKTPGAKKTLLFYAHFDGQPVGPPDRWATPAFEPTLRAGKLEDGAPVVAWADAQYPLPDGHRIYARAVSDDKGPIVAMLAAIDALRAANIPLSVNLKFFLEGEEEAGSPNPAARLADLIGSMRAPDGRITIDGLVAPAPTEAQLALAREAFDTPGMLAGAGIAVAESGLDYGPSVLRPALNVTQLLYGGTGPQRNAIDPEATAGLDLRLTPGMSVAQSQAAIEAHVHGQGYVLLDRAPTAAERLAHPRLARIEWSGDGYPAAVSSPDEPGVARVIAVMRAATGDTVRVLPLMGGSLPISSIGEVLGAPFVIVPIVNADNSQHAPNENLRMKEFRQGIGLFAALLAATGSGW
jgi:acetylornithine deacetylase/succinyl-diaminopimelate desuccinylase-like protein